MLLVMLFQLQYASQGVVHYLAVHAGISALFNTPGHILGDYCTRMYNLLASESDTELAKCVEITIENKVNTFAWYVLSNITHSSVSLFPFPSLP
jgi:hypothetical protein